MDILPFSNVLFALVAGGLEGLRPVFFVPCTLVRTLSTRPEDRCVHLKEVCEGIGNGCDGRRNFPGNVDRNNMGVVFIGEFPHGF